MIRVLLVDDHSLVRAGLQLLIDTAPDLVVVGGASDGAEAVQMVQDPAPDIVLMDLAMPGMDGVEATRRINAGHGGVQVVVLTSFLDADHVRAAIESGAVGYLMKDAEPRDLLEGIRAVVLGESPLDSRAAGAMLRTDRSDRSTSELTEREREVLSLVANGLANKQIARALDITESTVKAHLGSIFQRIGVSDRTSAAVWAGRHLPDTAAAAVQPSHR